MYYTNFNNNILSLKTIKRKFTITANRTHTHDNQPTKVTKMKVHISTNLGVSLTHQTTNIRNSI